MDEADLLRVAAQLRQWADAIDGAARTLRWAVVTPPFGGPVAREVEQRLTRADRSATDAADSLRSLGRMIGGQL
ncbi:MAG: hypothetical protein AAF467_26765 [Actinomycetota bacterium]